MTKKTAHLDNINVLLGVTAGIAAYKAVDLASKLSACRAKVTTVMTDNACQLIGPRSFEAITGSAVFTNLWAAGTEHKIDHVNLADLSDIVVVVPATANIIGKFANGICDDLLSTTLCTCWAKPVLLAPAMNDKMWNNPAVQQNINTLNDRDVKIIGPNVGRLACGTEAVGRMAEPAEILEAIMKIASGITHEKE